MDGGATDERAWRDAIAHDGSLELRRPPSSWTAVVVAVGITVVSLFALFSDEALNRWSGWVGIVVFGVVGIPVALHGSRAGYPRTRVDADGIAVVVKFHPLDRDHGWRRPWARLQLIEAQSDRADAVVVAVDDAIDVSGSAFVLPTYADVDARAWASWLESERRRRT